MHTTIDGDRKRYDSSESWKHSSPYFWTNNELSNWDSYRVGKTEFRFSFFSFSRFFFVWLFSTSFCFCFCCRFRSSKSLVALTSYFLLHICLVHLCRYLLVGGGVGTYIEVESETRKNCFSLRELSLPGIILRRIGNSMSPGRLLLQLPADSTWLQGLQAHSRRDNENEWSHEMCGYISVSTQRSTVYSRSNGVRWTHTHIVSVRRIAIGR